VIDTNDKTTQSLSLDEQPGKLSNVTGLPDERPHGVVFPPCPTARKPRGRPATGKAMTPAEKQRAYRERQKQKAACCNLGAANDRVKALEDQVQRLQAVRDELISELRATKKELESRYANPVKGLRKHRDDAPLKTILAHHNQMEDRRKSGELSDMDALWRFVGATLQVIEQHGLITPK